MLKQEIPKFYYGATFVATGGVIMVTFGTENGYTQAKDTVIGLILVIIATIIYGNSCILAKYFSGKYFDGLNMNIYSKILCALKICIYMGIICLLFFWPFLLILNFLNIEPFDIPKSSNKWLTEMIIIALFEVGLTTSLITSIILTSPIFVSLGSQIIIPILLIIDIITKHVSPNPINVVGSIIIILSLFILIKYQR